MSIYFPDDTKDSIDAIRDAIGREVIFRTVASLSGCSVCSLDPVTDTSTDSFCPVCSGVYWIKTYQNYSINAHITWGNADMLDWRSGGQLFEGDCRLQIELQDNTLQMIEDTEIVIVDGKTMEIRSTMQRGVPELNRVILELDEKEK